MITEQSMVRTAEGLAVADLGGEAVILDANAGRYYGINEVGLRILELAGEPRTVRGLVELLLGEFEVDEEDLRSDVMSFLDVMVEQHLVVVDNAAPG